MCRDIIKHLKNARPPKQMWLIDRNDEVELGIYHTDRFLFVLQLIIVLGMLMLLPFVWSEKAILPVMAYYVTVALAITWLFNNVFSQTVIKITKDYLILSEGMMGQRKISMNEIQGISVTDKEGSSIVLNARKRIILGRQLVRQEKVYVAGQICKYLKRLKNE